MKIKELFETDISGKHLTLKDIKLMGKTELSARLGVDENEIKQLSDQELKIILNLVGKHDFKTDNHFNTHELNLGIKIEREHTDSNLIAKIIAKDHLMEIPDYYTRLTKMEKEA